MAVSQEKKNNKRNVSARFLEGGLPGPRLLRAVASGEGTWVIERAV